MSNDDPVDTAEALRRIREIRTQVYGPHAKRAVVDVEAPVLETDKPDLPGVVEVTEPPQQDSGGAVEGTEARQQGAVGDVEVVEAKYQMETAAHRETTQALLAEKDETIAALKDLVIELRAQLEAARSGDRVHSLE